MKLKGVNPFEQHVEKIVLVVVVFVLLGVIAMQFVTQPNTIEVGSREVAPDAIYQVLGEQARSLESQISDTSPRLPDVKDVDLVARYDSAFEASEEGVGVLPAPLGTGVDVVAALGVDNVTSGGGNFDEIEALTVPVTSSPIAVSRWATLDPFALSENPGLGSLGSGGSQPIDFASVSIEASFSGSDLRKVLEGEDGFPGVPRLFWASTGMAVMGLEVERQKLMDDGSWGPGERIERPAMSAMPTNAVRASDPLVRLNEVVGLAQEHAPDVIRPAFVPTISGPEWEAPSLADSTGRSSLSEEERLTRKLASLEEELDRVRNAGRRTTTRPGGGGGGGKTPTRDPRTGPSTTSRPGGSGNDARIERIEREIEGVREDLDRLGVEIDDRTRSGSGTLDVLREDSLQMWAHDMGVEPGATYRYRTRVAVNNPYFRKGPYLDEADQAQQALTVDPFARGDWSDWSDPVRVGAKELFFVSSASTNTTTGTPAEVKVELYSMYYGYYRRRSMTLSPGDVLASDVPVSGDLLLFDRGSADAKAIERYLEDTDSRDRTLPDGVTMGPDRRMIDLGAYVIEVLADPISSVDDQGGLVRSVSVLLRDRDGSLEERRPAMDTGSTLFEQVSASASEGARAEIRAPGSEAAAPGSAGLFEPAP